jgi:hypothetical protein
MSIVKKFLLSQNESQKIILLMMSVALLYLTVAPVFVNGNDFPHCYISKLWAGRDQKEVGLVIVEWEDDTTHITYKTKDARFLKICTTISGVTRAQTHV